MVLTAVGSFMQQQLPDPEDSLGDFLVLAREGVSSVAWQEWVRAGKHRTDGVRREWSQASRGPASKGLGGWEASCPRFPWFTDTLT